MDVRAAGGGAAGAALGAVFGTVARLRSPVKPLHPYGTQASGTLTRYGCDRRWGVPWLDEPGTERVLVRFSRAVGLPGAVPDILGLTLRVELPSGHADLLLATTGQGLLSRFVLVPRRDPSAAYGSLMAYRTPTGPAWLRAHVRSTAIALLVGGPTGRWWRFGDISLEEAKGDDPVISFDPVLRLGEPAPRRRVCRGARGSSLTSRQVCQRRLGVNRVGLRR